MASISGALTEVIGSVRGVLGLSRQSRLREQISETTELYKQVKEHSELQAAATDIADVVKLQTSRLLAAAEPPATKRSWEWGGFSVGMVVTCILGGGAWLLGRPAGRAELWWLWFPAVALGLLAFVCFLASVSLLLTRKPVAVPPPAGIALTPPST